MATAAEDEHGVPRIEVRLLGPVEVVRDGVVVDLGGPQPRAVVAHLALEIGRVVAAERLVDRLWGDDAPGSPLGTLQSYVSRLRRAIEPEREAGRPAKVLASEAPGYVLRLPAERVDVEQFRSLVAEARSVAASGHHGHALARFDAALDLWRGPALAGLGPEETVRPIVVALDEERAAALEDRFDTLLALGRHAEAVAPLQTAVAESPLRERLWASLALALYRSRRQGDALRAIASARETLVDELGIDPGPDLRDLERRILDQDPTLLATPAAQERPAPAAPITTGRSGPELVGRTAEWAALNGVLEDAARGDGRLALVEGEPGIGKTTVCEALAATARERGWTVVVGRCVEPGLAPTLWAWIEVIRALVAASPDAPESTRSALASLVDPTGAGPSTPVELADHVGALVRGHAETAPTMVVLDDVHWADRETLELLGLVMPRLTDARVVVVAAFRPPELVPGTALGTALGTITRGAHVVRVALGGLDEHDVGELMAIVSGVAPAPELAVRIRERTAGNPLFVAELARLAGRSGVVEATAVPDAIRDVVRGRLAGLPPTTREVLEVAAVLGQWVDLRTVTVASSSTIDECLDALEPAVVTRILVPDDVADFRFAHALVRDAVLADMSALRVTRLHLRAADAIASVRGVGPDQAEPIAWHRLAAASIDDPARVAEACVLAGDVARWRGALDQADVLLEHALSATERMPPGPEAAALDISALESLVSNETLRSFMGNRLDVIHARIEEAAARHPGPFTQAFARFIRWSAVNVHPIPVGRPEMEAQLAATSADDIEYVRVLAHCMAGNQYWFEGALEPAAQHLHEAVAAGMEALDADPPHRYPGVMAPGFAAIVDAMLDDDESADAMLESLAGRWFAQRRMGDPTVVVDLAFIRAMVAGIRDDPAGAAHATSEVAAPDPPAYMPLFSDACRVLNSWGRVMSGDAAAADVARLAVARLDEQPVRVGMPCFRTYFGATLLAVDDADAVDALDLAATEARDRGEVWWLPETLRLAAVADERFVGGDRAASLLDEAARLAEQHGSVRLLRRITETLATRT